MEFQFRGPVWYWRGPAPYHFVTVPESASREIEANAARISYGWGMIPASVRIGETSWTTALWPKDGRYIVPLKDRVRRAEQLDLDDMADVKLTVDGL